MSRTRAARALNIAAPTLRHWQAEAKSNLGAALERVARVSHDFFAARSVRRVLGQEAELD